LYEHFSVSTFNIKKHFLNIYLNAMVLEPAAHRTVSRSFGTDL